MCDKIINFHNRYKHEFSTKFSDRIILNLYPIIASLTNDEFDSDIDVIKKVTADLSTHIQTIDQNAFINYHHITEWRTGVYQPTHKDYQYHPYTTILYLNDEFEGGETIIEGEKIKPEKGALLTFPGNIVNHSVNEVINGTRYTIAAWHKSF